MHNHHNRRDSRLDFSANTSGLWGLLCGLYSDDRGGIAILYPDHNRRLLWHDWRDCRHWQRGCHKWRANRVAAITEYRRDHLGYVMPTCIQRSNAEREDQDISKRVDDPAALPLWCAFNCH
jgi:hypothetical protein